MTLTDVLQATAYVVPALEIIDARIEQFDRDTRAPRKVFDTIADFAANAGVVPGGRPVAPDALDLRWVGALLYKNSVIEETGLAAGVLNHPATGVAWLANKIAKYDEQLNAGDFVMSGSFTRPTRPQKAMCCTRTTGRSGTWPSASSDPGDVMKLPENTFKRALREGRPQIGLWVGAGEGLRERAARPRPGSTGWRSTRSTPRTIREPSCSSFRPLRPIPTHPVVRTLSDDASLHEAVPRYRRTDRCSFRWSRRRSRRPRIVQRDSLPAGRHSWRR